jgi:hypothetical protein
MRKPPAPDHAPAHLPEPSIWPLVMAAGVALLALGVITTWEFALAGAAGLVLSLAGWLGELLRDE